MWHETIKKLDTENLVTLGVVQEQHAERTRLYKQWKQYDFPIVQDPITKLGAAVVPIFIGIDEHGIVRNTRLRPSDLKTFLTTEFEAPETAASILNREIDFAKRAAEKATSENLCMLGDQEMLFRTSGSQSHNRAIDAYKSALAQDPENADTAQKGTILFRLGAAYRQRYDERSHADADFDLASKYWTLAMQANPRQYIWRRRIEQYGPRLQKPYPFYDWVRTAIEEIEARGETPVQLTVDLTQSELGDRSKPDYSKRDTMPEATEELERDNGRFISIQHTMVPGFVAHGEPATVHLRLVPTGAKWSNESTPLTVWVESKTMKLSQQLFTHTVPDEASSTEDRSFEFDLLVDESNVEGSINGFALYNVCTEDGVCMYLRQDFEIVVPSSAVLNK